ncbi:hypothetical protein BDZ85DRAFT_60823 [Elsinoe ampelina]|uniref:Uncharacterized protein n=1 Tax=Elsinoe ampelina TaxID=302913 RepID=A0A6A6G029_9PEZI|nr:hypothetical protein BDZ85DRAFT_60823 [Elsinoe ampelina]
MLASLSSFFHPSNLTPRESSHEGVRMNMFTSKPAFHSFAVLKNHPRVHHSVVMAPSSSIPKHNARSHPPTTHPPHHPPHPRRAAQVAQQDRAAQGGTQSPGVGSSGTTGPVDGHVLAQRLSQLTAGGGASSGGASAVRSGAGTPGEGGGESPIVGKGSPAREGGGTPTG